MLDLQVVIAERLSCETYLNLQVLHGLLFFKLVETGCLVPPVKCDTFMEITTGTCESMSNFHQLVERNFGSKRNQQDTIAPVEICGNMWNNYLESGSRGMWIPYMFSLSLPALISNDAV